ncbi:MAG: hypothetical protein Q8L53_06205, partial [Aestuariivirga sp.]|nr:hypothetical protein [Aestuariivirga sp.]
MIFRPLQSQVINQIEQANAQGISSGCPFCMARERKELVPGDQIVLLAGSRAGHTFKIVPQEDIVFADYYAEDLTTP